MVDLPGLVRQAAVMCFLRAVAVCAVVLSLASGCTTAVPADPADAPPGLVALRWTEIALGEGLRVTADNLLLDGEGEAALELQTLAGDATTVVLPVSHIAPEDRTQGAVDVLPEWAGIQPGPLQVRIRARLDRQGVRVNGPWTEPLALTLGPPTLRFAGTGLRRGAPLPVAVAGVPPGAWSLLVEGAWEDGHTHWHAPLTPVEFAGEEWLGRPLARASSDWFLTHVRPVNELAGPGVRLRVSAQLLVRWRGQEWRGVPVTATWQVLADEQVVFLELGSEFADAVNRFGLSAWLEDVRAEVRSRAQDLFHGYHVRVVLEPPVDTLEFVHLRVIDDDPNKLGLLGVDNSLGKDTGNLVLDEDLSGYNPERAALGQPAYGGVFLRNFFAFSPSLHPATPMTDKRFDDIFGPYAPILDGTPAVRDVRPDLAIATLAHLIAHTSMHEVGHALGLAAVDGAFHHPGDNPGWIMDSGIDRPFAERAGLPGADPQIWGPIDAAYLALILPTP